MAYGYYAAGDFPRLGTSRSSPRWASIMAPALGAIVAFAGGVLLLSRAEAPQTPRAIVAEVIAVKAPAVAATVLSGAETLARTTYDHAKDSAWLDPTLLRVAPVAIDHEVALGSDFAWTSGPLPAPAPIHSASADPVIDAPVTPLPPAMVTATPDNRALPLPATPDIGWNVPLPAPRPPEFRAPRSAPVRAPRVAEAEPALPPSAPPDQRSFFEKLFQGAQPNSSALAYAPSDGDAGIGRIPLPRMITGPRPVASRNPEAGVAVYEIATHTVYLPDGERLEAHSGLGDRFDDPRYVAEHMRGPTPPTIYDLALRETLFHGVQALRLSPIDGDAAAYGRTGLLAHTYMLGARGDSNGCVSFRNYPAFLHAYESGLVRRLVVVARID